MRAGGDNESYLVLVGKLEDKPYEIFCGLSQHVEVPKKAKTGILIKNGKKDGVATYILLRAPGETSAGGSTITLPLVVRSITDTQYTVYGNSTDKTIITTVVSVSGLQSGATKEFEVQITK